MDLITVRDGTKSLPVFPNGLRKLKTRYSSWESYYTRIYNTYVKDTPEQHFFIMEHHPANHFSLSPDTTTIVSSKRLGKEVTSSVFKLVLKWAHVMINVILSIIHKKRARETNVHLGTKHG